MLLDRVYTLHISGLRRCVAFPESRRSGSRSDVQSWTGEVNGWSQSVPMPRTMQYTTPDGCRWQDAGKETHRETQINSANYLRGSPTHLGRVSSRLQIGEGGWGNPWLIKGETGMTFVRIRHVDSHVKIRPCYNAHLPSSQLCRNEETFISQSFSRYFG
jgi:hypothetical protein